MIDALMPVLFMNGFEPERIYLRQVHAGGAMTAA